MSAKTIKSALGLLQDDPDNGGAWSDLRAAVGDAGDMGPDELAKLLDAARRAHQGRREIEAVARLLRIEVDAAKGTPREVDLLQELARVLDEELLDDAAARAAYERLRDLRPGRPAAHREIIQESAVRRTKWREIADRYTQEARSAGDGTFRSSLLVSAAEIVFRYGRDGEERLPPENLSRVLSLLGEALSLDTKSNRAELLLERVLRQEARWDDLAAAIEKFANLASKEEKVASWVRLARVYAKKLKSPERAASAYERALDVAPGQSGSVELPGRPLHVERDVGPPHRALRGAALARLPEVARRGSGRAPPDRDGALAHAGQARGGGALLRAAPQARSGAPRDALVLPRVVWRARRERAARDRAVRGAAGDARTAPERAGVVAEIAKLAEEGANAQKAVEQWRSVLRQDPRNREAREALKRLYRQTASYGALIDLLRQELEKIPSDDAAARLPILRDIAGIYRDHMKSDSALVTVLTQVVTLDPTDLSSVRDLVRVYQSLQRWRDLLTTQARQADLERDPGVKADLWKAIARRWLEQFSNVQNAVEAYEKLHAVDPSDAEAVDKLKELYAKRRSYKPLYELLAQQADAMAAGPARREVWTEMAKLAAERLDMGPQAVALYKRVLEEDPSSAAALDALERQAERDKDFATVAEVLERRATIAIDDAGRMNVLQKLGAIYSDRLHDGPKATAAWRRVLALQPGHAKALRVLRDRHLASGDYDGLTELYEQSGDWEGLVEVLSSAADKTADPELKVNLSFRCATIFVDRIGAPERAYKSYERVLSVNPGDTRAAAALVPLYEKEEKWGRLPALYEILLEHAYEVDEKLVLLDKLVKVCGHELQDRPAEFAWARKAYELAPRREGGLVAFEAAARHSSQWEGFVEALQARLSSIEPAAEGTRSGKKRKKKERENGGEGDRRYEIRALRGKLAEVYASELGRVDEAVAAYRALIEEDDSDELAIQTLDRILRESDRRDDLRWLFGLRVERANTAFKLDLLGEWALLEEEAFASTERAVELHRRMLQIVPHHGAALRSLARLLRAQGDAAGAVEIIAVDRDQRQGVDRAVREIELARLLADPLRRYVEALEACERALALVPNESQAIEVVEQLLAVPETRASAAATLERAYDELGMPQRQAEVLEVLIGTTAASSDRLALYGRLADVYQAKLSDPGAAFEVLVRAAGELPGEIGLWDRLAELAAATGRAQALVEALVAAVPPTGRTGLPEATELELADRIAVLYDETLGDVEHARPYLERLLDRQPNNERAFLRLKQILTTSEQWPELSSLYERIVAATTDPPRRCELLAEVALVAEEITGEPGRAISYYERILELDPTHEQAIGSLNGLYAREQRWDRLAQLVERRLAGAAGDDRIDLEQHLGTLLFDKLGDPGGALAYLEHVLRERPSSSDARRLVEKILEVPELRSRAAIVLEAVYADRDEVVDLVRVLEIHLEFASSDDERRDLLRRVAELRDDRLRDDPGSLDAFARLLPLDPDDARARERMIEIARRTKAYDRAADVLAATATAAGAPLPRAEILMDLARWCERELHDVSRADSVYGEIVKLAPEDAAIASPACHELERIYAAAGQHREYGDILRLEVKLEDDAETRRELRGRLGELCETLLDDPRGAVEAWRARLEDDPSDAQALAALDRLYERTQSWRELVDVLRARERVADDAPSRRNFLVRIATTLADKLTDVKEAIDAYRVVVDDFGADRASLAALAPQYELSDRWSDLAETLEADLALAEGPTDKLAILARLGEVRQEKLGEIEGAIDAYRQALALDPTHVACRTALEDMLENPTARREAAAILRPLYEVDGLHEKLLKVLDIEAEYIDQPQDKLAIVADAAKVAEEQLRDPALAFSYASRGLRAAVAEPELPKWIERAERLAAATGRYLDLTDLLRSVVDEILDGDVQLEVTRRIAEVARTRLGEVAVAKQYYARALELRSDDRRALVALESLHEETGDDASLLEIVKRRVEAAESDSERRELLFKQARLCDEKLRDERAAISVYEQILDLGLDSDAVSALERLYERSERWQDLVALYERQIAAPGVSRERQAALHHALGGVLERRVQEFDRAFDEYAAALAIDPLHPHTVASLELLMGQRDHAARAAEMLEPVYLARFDGRRVMSTIEARLGASQDPDERRQLLRRLAKMHEEQEDNYDAALDATAKLLGEDPSDETTWAELERLARVSNAEGRLAEIYASELAKINTDEPATARLAKRTGELFEAQSNVERALVFYRRAYAFDPEAKDGTFQAIDRLLRAAGRPWDRVKHYRESLDYVHDGRDRLASLHTIAALEETELKDDSAAIDTYRAALEVDEGDYHSLDALSRLYARSDRWRDLADLTRRRAEQSALPEDEARFRMELARLLSQKLSETSVAVDELQLVVELVPTGAGPGADAVVALEALLPERDHRARAAEILRPIYERSDDWHKLVSLNEVRLALATDESERISILRESATLWEERGGDLDRAFEAMRQAWTADPEDGDAREQLDRLAGTTGRWNDLADAYEQAIEKADGLTKRELLAALARLHDTRRDDPRRSLEAWGRLFDLDETEVQPLEEMDALATLLSDWTTLVGVLVKKAELLPDDDARASTWRRIGEAKRDMLDDATGAIEAYERALELEPESTFTIDELIALYEKRDAAARLVDLQRRRVELCGPDEEDLKFTLLVDAARRLENDLGDRREAIECLTQAQAVRPRDQGVLRRLDALYTQQRMWPELLDNLKAQASAPEHRPGSGADPQEADRRALRVGAPRAAGRPGRVSRGALLGVRRGVGRGGRGDRRGERRAPGGRRERARARAAGRRQARGAGGGPRAAPEGAERGGRSRAHAARSRGGRRDVPRRRRARARGAAAGARGGPAGHLPSRPHRAPRRTHRDRGWKRYADALDERAGSGFDANVGADLYERLGDVSEKRLDDPSRAAKAYASAVERSGDEPKLLASLDRLFVRLGDNRSLADVIERRIAVEPRPEDQAELLHRLATLQIEEFGERSRGLATLRQGLERLPDHAPSREALEKLLEDDDLFDDAFEALESVHRTLGRSEELARLYERKVTRAEMGPERARARLDLARVLEDTVGDRARAQRVVEAALAEDPSDDEALRQLERLAAADGAWRQAADALAAALAKAEDLPAATRSELWTRLAGWRLERLVDATHAEAAYAQALTIDPENLDVLRAVEGIQRAPGRERDLIGTLRTRARLEVDSPTKRELLREAKTLAEGPARAPELAEAALRRLVADDEVDSWALEELTRLREAAGDHAEVVSLLLRRSELADDPLPLKHEAARVLVRLNDPARAISLYEEILEAEPNDSAAAVALRALYGDAGNHRELGRLLERLVDVATTQEARVSLRLELAALQVDRFQAPEEAIESLRSILDEEPTHAEAVLRLSQIYEQTGRDAELADLLRSQLEAAHDRQDVTTELSLLVRLGEVQERRLGDATSAQRTYEEVLDRDSNHRGALEAVARMSEKRSEWDRAAAALAKLLDLSGKSGGVPFALRLAEAREKMGDLAGAEAALQQGLALEPTNTGLRGMLRSRYERAERWSELADLLVGDADVIAVANPNDHVAADYVQDGIATGPRSIPPPSMSGSIPPPAPRGGSIPPPSGVPASILERVKLLRAAADIHAVRRGRPQDAIPILERAAEIFPQDRTLLLALCDAYNSAQRGRDAAQVLEKVIASFGTKRPKELALYHHRLGQALAQLGEKDVALTQLDMAFKIDPGSVSVLRDLGVLAYETNDLDRAQKTFRALLLQRLDRGAGISKGEVFYYLGEISAKQGDRAKAVQMLERAIETDPALDRARAKLSELKG